LSSFLARFAGNIFWLARYLERAENLARILDINQTYSRDNREGPNWQRVLDLYVDTENFEKRYQLADAKSVLSFYVLDKSNQASIVSCMRAARENARTVRHLISTEMWAHLNVAYGKTSRLGQSDIRVSALSPTLKDIILQCQSFEGIIEGTFLKDEPWCFYQLGKYIERADQTTRILDMGYDRLTIDEGDAIAWVQWNVLLRSLSGYHAFAARHPGAQHPFEIVSFLLYDTGFPRAVALCIERLSARFDDIEKRHAGRHHAMLAKSRRELEYAIETGPGTKFTARELHAYLDRLQLKIADLSENIAATYFDPAAD
jgi:uncharacterized alpha-E superfamily protein